MFRRNPRQPVAQEVGHRGRFGAKPLVAATGEAHVMVERNSAVGISYTFSSPHLPEDSIVLDLISISSFARLMLLLLLT